MIHSPRSPSRQGSRRKSEDVHAWLVGADIGCLAAAVHLIQDAKVPGPQIHILKNSASQSHILEAFPVNKGFGLGTESYPEEGQFSPIRILNRDYVCTNDLLSRIPSLSAPMRSVQDELIEPENDRNLCEDFQTKVIINDGQNMQVLDAQRLELRLGDRGRIKKMMLESKQSLMKTRIMDIFDKEFFHSKFWMGLPFNHGIMPRSSSVIFNTQDFANLHTLSPIDSTPYELFNGIIIPITSYLQAQGVEIEHNVNVLDVLMDSETDPILASGLKISQSGTEAIINLCPQDILIVTVGSIFAGSTLGTNRSPPAPIPNIEELKLDDSWNLWFQLSGKHPEFGNPSPFCARIAESAIECFLIALDDWAFFKRSTSLVHAPPHTGTLVSLKDSNWHLGLNLPRQPPLASQPESTPLIWGYGLSPSEEGNFIRKPMSSCSGEEVPTEVLQQMQLPPSPTLEHSTVVTSLMPLATAQYLTRDEGDRPNAILNTVRNMALIGQFVELPDDTVFSMEYSVRSAQMAVYHLMSLDKKPKAHKSYWDSFWANLS